MRWGHTAQRILAFLAVQGSIVVPAAHGVPRPRLGVEHATPARSPLLKMVVPESPLDAVRMSRRDRVLPAVPTPTASADWVTSVVQGERSLPSLAMVQHRAAEWFANASDQDVANMFARARWRGAIPRIEFSLGTDSDVGLRDSFTQNVARTTTEGRAFGIRIGARWELGDLVLGDREIAIFRETTRRLAWARAWIDDVTRLYFDRVDILLAQEREAHPELNLRAALLEGLMDARTGGGLIWPSLGQKEHDR